jgi:hypothetical protein
MKSRLAAAVVALAVTWAGAALADPWSLSGAAGSYRTNPPTAAFYPNTVEIAVFLAVTNATGASVTGLTAANFSADIENCDQSSCVFHRATVGTVSGALNIKEQVPGVYQIVFRAPASDALGQIGNPGLLVVRAVTKVVGGGVSPSGPTLIVTQHAQIIMAPH